MNPTHDINIAAFDTVIKCRNIFDGSRIYNNPIINDIMGVKAISPEIQIMLSNCIHLTFVYGAAEIKRSDI